MWGWRGDEPAWMRASGRVRIGACVRTSRRARVEACARRGVRACVSSGACARRCCGRLSHPVLIRVVQHRVHLFLRWRAERFGLEARHHRLELSPVDEARPIEIKHLEDLWGQCVHESARVRASVSSLSPARPQKPLGGGVGRAERARALAPGPPRHGCWRRAGRR